MHRCVLVTRFSISFDNGFWGNRLKMRQASCIYSDLKAIFVIRLFAHVSHAKTGTI